MFVVDPKTVAARAKKGSLWNRATGAEFRAMVDGNNFSDEWFDRGHARNESGLNPGRAKLSKPELRDLQHERVSSYWGLWKDQATSIRWKPRRVLVVR